jgi:hypothetical protein
VIENTNIDENNVIYKPGNTYYFDYKILLNGEEYKLYRNNSTEDSITGEKIRLYQFMSSDTDSIGFDQITMHIKSLDEDEVRSNHNQTQLVYKMEIVNVVKLTEMTGLVENSSNIWIHPIRDEFFNSLETAPFPYLRYPLKIGAEWEDQMSIGEHWADTLWGEWEGRLLWDYKYQITDTTTLDTDLGMLKCYIIESSATSDIGVTYLTSYFNEEYGFVRYEYELLNGLKILIWLIDFNNDIAEPISLRD